jgi:hypothetical protein
MKTLQNLLFTSICILGFNSLSEAQTLKMPQLSSTQSFTQEFGLGKISVTYSRPNVKGREIFGGLEPYDKVWRTGANGATVIKFSDEVQIEGKTVPAGEYGLFTIPGKNEWTIIINKGAQQWGSYTYKESDDLLRVKVKPVTLKDKVETFTIQFANVSPSSAQLQLVWANTLVPVSLTTDVDAKVIANIDDAMKADKKPYVQAAQYYYLNNKDINKALTWINAAEVEDQTAPWIKYWKAKIQLKAGDKKGAITTAEAGAKLAQEKSVEEYVRLNNSVIAEARK